jgi:hypothetical protein
MLISELTVDDFLKDKIKLSDSDAKRYAKEMAAVGEKLDSEINLRFKESDYVTKLYLDTRISQLETRIEKGFKEIIIWVIGFMVGIVGIAVAIIKLF